MYPRVKEAYPLKDYKLKVIFTDNSEGIFDCCKYLDKGIFIELKNPAYFNKVKVSNGTITWSNGQDFCPDTVYIERKLLFEISALNDDFYNEHNQAVLRKSIKTLNSNEDK